LQLRQGAIAMLLVAPPLRQAVQQALWRCDRFRVAQQSHCRRGQARQAAGIGSDDLKRVGKTGHDCDHGRMGG
jgi:hypothetical protein